MNVSSYPAELLQYGFTTFNGGTDGPTHHYELISVATSATHVILITDIDIELIHIPATASIENPTVGLFLEDNATEILDFVIYAKDAGVPYTYPGNLQAFPFSKPVVWPKGRGVNFTGTFSSGEIFVEIRGYLLPDELFTIGRSSVGKLGVGLADDPNAGPI